MNLFLQDQLPVAGDFVVVHVGYAIQIIAPDVVCTAGRLYDEMLAGDAGTAHACASICQGLLRRVTDIAVGAGTRSPGGFCGTPHRTPAV